MSSADELAEGRRAFEQHRWRRAFEQLSAADETGRLEPEDLERLATAAHLSGYDDAATAAQMRAHELRLARGEHRRAAGCAFWLGIRLMLRGEAAQAGGWLARAGRLLGEVGRDEAGGAEHGYLLVPEGLQRMHGGELADALASFRRATEVGARCRDHDLVALGLAGEGQVLLRQSDIERGVRCLDEAMVGVTAGEVSPEVAGIVYCAVVEQCQLAHDVRRSREWTAALSRWCDSEPEMVPYQGQCLVHRAQVLQLHGEWDAATDEAERACARLSDPPHPALGMALYQLGELHRLRGRVDDAADAFQRANDAGFVPQPGLAQLRLAQGVVDAAVAAIRGALGAASDEVTRLGLLPATVEILGAVGDVEGASSAAAELSSLADVVEMPLITALATRAEGTVLLLRGQAGDAHDVLRRSWRLWRDLDAPWEAARTQLMIGEACRMLGDPVTAEMERRSARTVLDALGAADGIPLPTSDEPTADRESPVALTAREREVLAQIAAGTTNRDIAASLVISEKTVERHVSNLFAKLGVSNRAAATAYAYEHDLV